MGDVTAVKTLMRLRCVKLVHFVFKMLYKSTQSKVVEGQVYKIDYHYKLVKHWHFRSVVGPNLPTQSISI